MTAHQQATAAFELNKYLQLFHGDEDLQNLAPRGGLNDRIELTIARLAVYGVFIVLTDAERLQFVAGGHKADANDPLSRIIFWSENDGLPEAGNANQETWISIFQELGILDTSIKTSDNDQAFSIPDVRSDPRTNKLAAATKDLSFSFLAGIPLTAKNGQNIGVICVVDRSERPPLSRTELDVLAITAQRCLQLLDAAHERVYSYRWTAIQRELDVFLESRSLHGQLPPEPRIPPAQVRSPMEEKKADKIEGTEIDPFSLGRSDDTSFAGLGDPLVEGRETKRLADAVLNHDGLVAAGDNSSDAQTSTVERNHDHDARPKGETTYRKLFRRAANCLQSALKADGIVFFDGIIGLHGDVQPVAEPERELEREIVPQTDSSDKLPSGDCERNLSDRHDPRSPELSGGHSRIYSSAEYCRRVYVARPAEVLGLAGPTSETILALSSMDGGLLQRLMDRYSDGAVWHSPFSWFMQVKDETLLEIDLEEEARALSSIFETAKQIMFVPLIDPTSHKRLGACFAWRNRSIPVFTDIADLGPAKAFLHVVESEVARYDASHVAKQKESFVSSVSHELRTPLHGVLGAVQLLDESGLDPMQKSLAKMITTCGTTLHETLTSVLSYAKINQFERRQHQYRQAQARDTVWALSNKNGLVADPDSDYEGLYVCTNLAMLCEEILGVLEAGKSFHDPHGSEVIVVCNIAFQENWNYYTEPGALHRIVSNLIGNALRYTKNGSIIVTLGTTKTLNDDLVESNDSETGSTAVFTVQDTGKGMSRSFMDHQLFLPFTQEDSTSTQGVGLGMSIVKSLVSLLSGEIDVRSEAHKGTEVKLRLPMKMRTPDKNETGQATAQFEDDMQKLRSRKLSAVIYGFPDFVRESLINYMRHWYACTLLEPTKDARPDIILVDEGNEEIFEAVNETATIYGKQGVLLSIVMVPSNLGKNMDVIDGYIKWERVPRPLGPNNVAKALLSCLEKLDDLRKHGENAIVDSQPAEDESLARQEVVNQKERPQDLSSGHYIPDFEKLRITEASPTSSLPLETSTSKAEPSEPLLEDGELESTRQQSGKPGADSPPSLRILLVDDNALNLKILGTFFKKKGYLATQEAKNGKEAVEVVSQSGTGFDVIFMDLSMPIMDGFEATRLIRKLEAGYEPESAAKASLIVALTALASQEDEDAAFNAGVDLFLTKPVHFPKLSKLLQQYKEGTLKPSSIVPESDRSALVGQ